MANPSTTDSSEDENLRAAHTPSRAGTRIVAIDALRGFALFGIVVVHMVEQYTAAPAPTAHPTFGVLSPLDQVVRSLVFVFFTGKFFAMFSVLFGLSFFIQMDRAAAKNIAFQGRFVWRLAVLFGIGLAHHAFYRGDILATYAVIGLVLVPFYRLSNRTLLTAAAILCLGAPRLLLVGLATHGATVPTAPEVGAANDAYYEILKGPSLLSVFAANLTEGMRTQWEYQFGIVGRGYQSLGLFLVGLYVGRRRWHESITELRRPLRFLVVGGLGASIGLAGLLAAVLLIHGGMPPLVSWQAVIAIAIYDVFNLSLMSSFIGAFLLLYRQPSAQRVLGHLALVGRLALTTYVCQSLVGTFFYYGYGLNHLGEIGATRAFVLAVPLFSGQILASALWLRAFRFGPLEYLWRTLTYGRTERADQTGTATIAPPHALM